MKEYWLAKLIGAVDEVSSRKQLQKSVYLLQVAGCPLQCDYILHYYGPYSFELAELMARLEGAGVVKETPIRGGCQYSCKITKTGKTLLQGFENTGEGEKAKANIEKFIPEFQDLNRKNVRLLELAATVAFLFQDDWDIAQQQTADFKKITPDNFNKLLQATNLAKSFLKSKP